MSTRFTLHDAYSYRADDFDHRPHIDPCGRTNGTLRKYARHFQPHGLPGGLADFDRSDWPVAYLDDAPSEEVHITNTIVDVPGHGFGRDDGFLFRRFASERFGRSRR